MAFRISKQQLNTSNKKYATNGNFVMNPFFFLSRKTFLAKHIFVLSCSMTVGPGKSWLLCRYKTVGYQWPPTCKDSYSIVLAVESRLKVEPSVKAQVEGRVGEGAVRQNPLTVQVVGVVEAAVTDAGECALTARWNANHRTAFWVQLREKFTFLSQVW